MNQHATAAVLTAATLAGTSGLFVKYLALPAPVLAFFRVGIPTLIAGALMLLQGMPLLRPGLRPMLVASLLNAGRMFCFFAAFRLTTVGNAIIVLYTWPVFATLFGTIWLKEPISRRQMVLLALAFAGLVTVASGQELSFAADDLQGMVAAVGHALLFSLTVVIFKRESQRFRPIETIFYQNVLGVPIFLPFLLTYEGLSPWQAGVASGYGVMIGLGIFGLFFYGLQRLPAGRVSFLSYIEIISATTLGVLVLGESLSWHLLVGGSMIIAATLLLQRPGQQQVRATRGA
ncbi:MAG: EamA/RhaT family transporter [Bacteroidetes bacterium]|nr:MAG: EamA/RhaT family transporter [Bacteroidota bacterium]